mmetsp:Transcript_93766/g.265163  ORF Transcript_93766/g.265163 Transcript_93766/m.265163 type:complete len:222 (-) Transcript_93766:69-734(-)|eukprot:CAMPEP_0168395228 /NCGR_PEP_ID=MMETSP0228-20121227/19939_1 /TAXON_ID=133427 /ORGANISM="Protoceratium reticulatum, Strain CCCM 535 (=CCMP 1889)" /LENGTH=221 /DNA_ID=CAMNT_0008408661 /DNA_START=56 /DNA_END=721 /DNA_ORIENTATION=+
MAMSGGMQAMVATLGIIFILILMWSVVPTEQTLDAHFPNVLMLRGFGSETIDPISFDNNSLPTLEIADVARLNGVYQFDPLFYHKSLDRFIPWEDREKTSIWECTMFCGPVNKTRDADVRLALVHTQPAEKKNLFYLLEMRDGDANSPIIYARSKFRKSETYRSPWMTVTPGGEVKPKDLKEVHIISAWDAFRFDTPLKWAVTVVLIVGSVLFWRSRSEWD